MEDLLKVEKIGAPFDSNQVVLDLSLSPLRWPPCQENTAPPTTHHYISLL